MIHQAGLTHAQVQTGAVTLIQRFGSAANLNIHLHCLMLDGVYRLTGGVPWSSPDIVDTSEKRENARGGVSCHNDGGAPKKQTRS